MGQSIDKSKGPRRSSSSESRGLRNGGLAPTGSQQVLWRGLPDAGQSVVRATGRVGMMGLQREARRDKPEPAARPSRRQRGAAAEKERDGLR